MCMRKPPLLSRNDQKPQTLCTFSLQEQAKKKRLSGLDAHKAQILFLQMPIHFIDRQHVYICVQWKTYAHNASKQAIPSRKSLRHGAISSSLARPTSWPPRQLQTRRGDPRVGERTGNLCQHSWEKDKKKGYLGPFNCIGLL